MGSNFLFPLILIVATCCSAGLTAVVIFFARRAKILDLPNERSSHARPTPRGGGITIVAGVTLAGIWVLFRDGHFPGVVVTWLLSGLFLASFSFADDFKPLPAILRLALQVFAAIAVLLVFRHGWPVLNLPGLPSLEWGMLGWALLFFWVLGLTNVYNFMDGIDGIAGAQGLVAGMGWLLLGHFWNEPIAIAAGLALGTTCAGFLVFNWPPAKIFMGDVGSAFLGFNFAVMPLLVHARNPSIDLTLVLGCAVLLLWPFLFDGGYTILHRIRKRENLLKAHRSHLYQRMVITGVSHLLTSILYGMLAVLGIGLAYMWALEHDGVLWWSVFLLAGLAGSLVTLVKVLEKRAGTPMTAGH